MLMMRMQLNIHGMSYTSSQSVAVLGCSTSCMVYFGFYMISAAVTWTQARYATVGGGMQVT